jgi:hypothetical protein
MPATSGPAGGSEDGPGGGGSLGGPIPKSVARGDPNAFTFEMIQQSYRREHHFKEVCALRHSQSAHGILAWPGDG